MAVAILDLIAFVVAKMLEFGRHLAASRICQESVRMDNRDRIRPPFPKHEQIGGSSSTTPARVIHNRFISQVLCHRAVPHAEWFFPDTVAGDIPKTEPFMESDNIPRKISHGVTTRVARWNIHTMHTRQSAW